MKIPSKNLQRCILLLSDNRFTSGSQLGRALNISRAAIWKIIKQIQKRGIQVECDKALGYRLAQPLVLLDCDRINTYLKTPAIIELFDTIDSTSQYLFERIHTFDQPLSFCLAEEQTKGHGRQSRAWHSPYAKNIYLSAYCRLNYDPLSLGSIVHHISLIIIETLSSHLDRSRLKIKWPNDILYDGRKIAGTLIESVFESNGDCKLVIGIGLNVNSDQYELSQIDQPASSILAITSRYIDRNPLVATLIDQIKNCYRYFDSHPSVSMPTSWIDYDCLIGQVITMNTAREKLSGTVVGYNEYGHLQLCDANGVLKTFSSGYASIQKSTEPETRLHQS